MLVTLYVSVQSVILKSDGARRLVELLQKRDFALLYGLRKAKEMKFSNHARPTPVGTGQ
jgi:hypothetical protein